jgi:pyridoxal phosphate enzyme (YggS family)
MIEKPLAASPYSLSPIPYLLFPQLLMLDPAAKIAENVSRIRGRIAEAAARSGRSADAVTLVAVTKYASLDAVRHVLAAGCHDLGESRPQQLWQRAESLADPLIRWHFIGHLQRNKVHRTLPAAAMVHSIDSPRLLAAIDEERLPSPMPVLLEVNVSGDAAKHGFSPDTVESFLTTSAQYKNVSIRGLMCMGGLESDRDATRREFASLRTLRDRLRPNCPTGVELVELSMGMSGDFEMAIEEGATLVRIGSALFE